MAAFGEQLTPAQRTVIVNAVRQFLSDVAAELTPRSIPITALRGNWVNQWRSLAAGCGSFAGAVANGTYLMPSGGGAMTPATDVDNAMFFPLDPADWVIPGLTAQLRLKASFLVNNTSSNPATVDAALVQATAPAGGGGAVAVTATNRMVTGSAAIRAANSSTIVTQATPVDFTTANFPVGVYALGGVYAAGPPGGAHDLVLGAQLQIRWV